MSRWKTVRAALTVDTLEDGIKVVVLLLIAAAALSASFSHVHDWTVTQLTAATGLSIASVSWLGWVNAVISELVPLVALLSLRRRLAAGEKLMSYALCLVLGGAALSISAQLAWIGGQASLSARFVAVLPAAAFIALSKLVVGDLDVARKRKAQAEELAARKAAEAADAAGRIARAEAEAEAARNNAAEALAEQEAERFRADQAEALAERFRAEAEALRSGSTQAEQEQAARYQQAVDAAQRNASDRDRARADADRARGERDAVRAQLAQAQAEAADLREQLAAARLTPERSAATGRKTVLSVVPPTLDDGSPVPVVDGVSPAIVAAVLNAFRASPGATRAELAEAAGTSDRTVRKVLNGVDDLAATGS